jgi:hypothetical protein
MVKSKKKTPWQIVKPLLEQDILSGEIPDPSEAKVVVQKRVEYDDVPIKNFKVNLKNLRLRINIRSKMPRPSSMTTSSNTTGTWNHRALIAFIGTDQQRKNS